MLLDSHEKAKTTLKILTNNMIAGDIPIENILKYYEEPTRENVILMLMRCKKMFDARVEAKKIVKLLIIH